MINADNFIYKICPSDLWREAENSGRFCGAGIDLVDGFIHFSTAAQVQETAALHFNGVEGLVLVQIDISSLTIVWEESRAGALFPHLYGDLPLSAVSATWPMPLLASGSHEFPSDVKVQQDNEPTEGFAIILAMIVVAIISIIAAPLLGLVGRSAQSTYEQRVTSHLSHEARENLELGVYLTKIADGPPSYFTTVTSASSRELADACERRLLAVNAAQLNGHTLTDNSTRHSPVTVSANRKASVFIVNKGTEQDTRYNRYLVISCALGNEGEIGLLTSELASLTGSYFTINLNEY